MLLMIIYYTNFIHKIENILIKALVRSAKNRRRAFMKRLLNAIEAEMFVTIMESGGG